MGWDLGAMIIGKNTVPELVPSAIDGFDGCLLTVEVHGYTKYPRSPLYMIGRVCKGSRCCFGNMVYWVY